MLGRDLHKFLEIKTKYTVWFERMVSFGFVEGVDFKAISQKWETAQGNTTSSVNHEITIEMAKQICMLARNEKGRQAREYFIAVEKAWNSPHLVMARALKLAEIEIEQHKKTIESQSRLIEEQKPKVLFSDAVETSDNSVLIGDLAKILNQNGIDIGSKRLFKWMRENGYLIKSGDSYNMPTQSSMNKGLFEVKVRTITKPDDVVFTVKTTKVTGKGQIYFVNKFLNKDERVAVNE